MTSQTPGQPTNLPVFIAKLISGDVSADREDLVGLSHGAGGRESESVGAQVNLLLDRTDGQGNP